MFCALEGADLDSPEGQDNATRAKELFRSISARGKQSTTIAVSKILVDGDWVEVVALNGGASASAVVKVRAAVESRAG
jgi:hypothetical protein